MSLMQSHQILRRMNLKQLRNYDTESPEEEKFIAELIKQRLNEGERIGMPTFEAVLEKGISIETQDKNKSTYY